MMFLSPKILLLLVLPLIMAIYQLRVSTDTVIRRTRLSAGLRVLVLSALTLAIARPYLVFRETSRRAVAVVDCSPSMCNVMEQTADRLHTLANRVGLDNLRLVVFGSSARELELENTLPAAEDLRRLCLSEPGSDVADAIDFAAALCPDDGNGDVYLFSDGRETRGDMRAAAAALGRRGMTLKYEELGTPATEPILLRPLKVPVATAVGEAVTITAQVESTVPREATLTLTDDTGKPLDSPTVLLKPGVQSVSFRTHPERVGFQRYSVSLNGSSQMVNAGLQVNRAVVGVIETAPDKPALLALRQILGRSAEVKSLALDGLDGSGQNEPDVIVLADTPVTAFPASLQIKLREWVENGGGLLVTGGRNAFGPGGYEGSHLAAMLPLRFPQKKELRDPSTALAVIIDTSGSMGAEGVSLAQEVARLALKRLKPNDKAGIVEFHGAKRWAAPMQAASNTIAIQRALNRLSCGGGTVLLPAIEEAYYGLMNIRARSKHVLVLTDGGVETGSYQSLVRSMVADKIHVSTVLVGPRSGSEFLAQMANWGQGQFYVAPSRFKLPEIIFKQPSSSLLDPFVEADMRVESVLSSEITQGLVFEEAPAVQGYVQTQPKETAELLLRSEVGDPLLARWHYGLGRTAILTTHLGGDWSRHFFNWPKSRDMMASLIRQLCGVNVRQAVDLQMGWSAAGMDLDVRALPGNRSWAAAPLTFEVRDRSRLTVATRAVTPVQANQWRTRFEGLAPGEYVVAVREKEGGESLASGGLVVPSPVEFTRVGANSDGLAGAVRVAREMAAARTVHPPMRMRELWPFCAVTALLCFVLMILMRRLPGGFAVARRVDRSGAAVLAFLVVMAFPAQSATAADQTERLDAMIRMRINRIIEMKATEARQEMKNECRKIVWRRGNLKPVCGYLRALKDPQIQPLLAVALIANGDFTEAEALLAKLAKNPDAEAWVSAELAQVRKRILESQERRNMALSAVLAPGEKEQINRIAAMKPDDARQALELECQQLIRRYGELTLLCNHLRSMTDVPAAKPLLAIAATADGNLAEADRSLSALAEDPEVDLWVLSELARIKEMLGDTAKARVLLERVLKKATEAGLRFALRVRLAQLQYEAKEPEAAQATLRSIADDPATEGQEARNYCARIAGLHGDDKLVVELFKPIGEGNGLRRNVLFLGEALMRRGESAEALKQFESALALSTLDRDRRYVLDRMVGVARAMNALPALIDGWLKSEDILPEQLDILVGILGGELDRTADVLALLERRDLPAKTRRLIETPAFQERMVLLASETGKAEFARLAYRKLIERHPDDANYRNGYVRLLLMEGDRAAAEDVYREVSAKARNAGELMEVAVSARGMGLKEMAIQAAGKAAGMGESAHMQAQLFTAEVHREQGDSDKALDILHELERGVKGDMDLITLLGQAYELNGFADDAIRLFQSADPTGNERVLVKLIALLESQNRCDEAFELWRRLWDTATEPMLIIQANDRLLDIGSKTGKLADLAIELEERLAQGNLREREQSLLLDIYTSVGDPVSASDILMEVSSQQGGESIATCKRLLRVYMESELFGRCSAVLHKLMALDPDNRDEYLQTLVLIALERKNDGDALVVLEQMTQRSKDGILRDSFSASVLKMIGRHDEASRVYRRALADNPDEVETWLMWGNAIIEGDAKERELAKKQGKREPQPHEQAGNRKACNSFSVLLEDAEADDLFTIAIDGLLNAQAPAPALQHALRRLNARIAADPHNFHLYRLSADLNEELRRLRDVDRSLGQGLIVADDECSIVMRELSAIASAEKRTNDMIAYGRSLLNIATHLPPEECLALGKMLLEKGHFNEAEVAFQRVISDSRALGTARGVIEQYENVGLFSKAGKVIRGLLIENPLDVELLLRLGLVEEKKGDFVAAGKAYKQAIDLMVGRLPRLARKAGEKGVERALDADEITLNLASAVRGLIVSTRTPESRQRLVDDVGQRVRDELNKLETSHSFAATAAENPRLVHLSSIMRRLCFVFHELGYGETMDDELLRRYPGDQELRARIVSERSRWRTFQSADALLIRNRFDDKNHRVAKAFLGGREAVEKMLAGKDLNATEQAETFTLLAMFGYGDLVDQVKAGCDLSQTPENDGEVLLTVGLVANRPELVRDALFTNLNRLRQTLDALGKGTRERSREYHRPLALYKQIVAAWPVLSEQDRRSAVSLYGLLIEKADYIDVLLCSYHFFLSQSGRAAEIPFDAVADYLKDYSNIRLHVSAIVDGWIGQQPAAQRPEAVRRLLGSGQGDARTALLAKLSEYLNDETLTEELKKEFPELAASRRRGDALPISTDEVSRMMAGKRTDVQKTITEARWQMGSDVCRLLTLHELTLRSAANMLPSRELDILIKEKRSSRDPFEKLIAFLLLIHAGRDTEAMAQLHVIAALDAGDAATEAVHAAMPAVLNAYGWHAHALRFRPAGFAASGEGPELFFKLHDPLAILEGKGLDRLGTSKRRIQAARLMASPGQYMQATRIYFADTRHPDVVNDFSLWYGTLTWPQRAVTTPGGLKGLKEQASGSILEDIVDLPGGQEELSHWLRAIETKRAHDDEICAAIAGSVSKHGLSPRLCQDWQAAAERSLLNRLDIDLISAIAVRSPEQLPKELAGQMRLFILNDRSRNAERTAALAEACKTFGQLDLARSLGRWSIMMDLQATGSSIRLPDYLAGFPEAERKKALRDLLPHMGLSNQRVMLGEGLGPLLSALLNHGMKDEATGIIDRYLRFRRFTRPKSVLLDTRALKAMFGEVIETDTNAQDDVIAAALARINRPEDYESILLSKARETPPNISTITRSTSLSATTPMDHTGALPEPGDVDEINRYIDIHLNVGLRLRREGELSPRSQVAWICMLGEWCAKRGLEDRASALLKQAEELSAGMFTGRLWVADLHRLLGNKEAAEQIEQELLDHDLLPLPRVPEALDVLAAKKGRAQADAVAFRIAGYSNHPQVLPQALRHARTTGLKKECEEITERLRKVNTLFMPPRTP